MAVGCCFWNWEYKGRDMLLWLMVVIQGESVGIKSAIRNQCYDGWIER